MKRCLLPQRCHGESMWACCQGRSIAQQAHISGNHMWKVIKVLKGTASLHDTTTQPPVIKSAIKHSLQAHYLTVSQVGSIAVAKETELFEGRVCRNLQALAAHNYAALFYVSLVLPNASLNVPLGRVITASKHTSIIPGCTLHSQHWSR